MMLTKSTSTRVAGEMSDAGVRPESHRRRIEVRSSRAAGHAGATTIA